LSSSVMRLGGYFKRAHRYWLGIGTIAVLYSTIKNGELSLQYIISVLILWGLLVGLPTLILYELGLRMGNGDQKIPSEDTKVNDAIC